MAVGMVFGCGRIGGVGSVGGVALNVYRVFVERDGLTERVVELACTAEEGILYHHPGHRTRHVSELKPRAVQHTVFVIQEVG